MHDVPQILRKVYNKCTFINGYERERERERERQTERKRERERERERKILVYIISISRYLANKG